MSQINIRVNKQTDNIFEYLAEKEKIPKAVLVKKMLLENLREKVLEKLLHEYENGQIQLKTIGDLLEMTPHELFQAVATHQIECPITPELDDYTRDITDSIIKKIQLENG